MKKLPKYFSHIGFTMLVWGAFLVPSAFAQSGHFILLQQGNVTASHFYNSGQAWLVEIGNGYTGTSTGAFISATFTASGLPGQNIRVGLEAFSDSTYTTNVQNCVFTGEDLPSGYSANGSSTNPFTQLTHKQAGLDFCTFNPLYYYKVFVNYQVGTISLIKYFGVPNWSPPAGWVVDSGNTDYPFFPQFAIVTDGFQITPTASSSGIFFSGAVSFCNDAFASSTGIGATIGNGLCIATGFLFVPTEVSVQQFSDFSSIILSTKIPFSYVYGINGLYSTLVASSTENLPTFSIPLWNFGSSSPIGDFWPTSITFFSTTTISTYYPDNIRRTLLALGSFAIWVSVVIIIYRRVVPHHITDTV